MLEILANWPVCVHVVFSIFPVLLDSNDDVCIKTHLGNFMNTIPASPDFSNFVFCRLGHCVIQLVCVSNIFKLSGYPSHRVGSFGPGMNLNKSYHKLCGYVDIVLMIKTKNRDMMICLYERVTTSAPPRLCNLRCNFRENRQQLWWEMDQSMACNQTQDPNNSMELSWNSLIFREALRAVSLI